jgi:hypothetical protein
MRKVCVVVGFAILVAALSGCATGYHASGFKGGFSQTKVSEDTYQVQVTGNGYTTSERASQFLLRRCAELTLESGRRYFAMLDSDSDSRTEGTPGFAVISKPTTSALIKLLPSQDAAPSPFDAVLIIRETDAVAKGVLSEAAKRTLAQVQ